MPEFRVYVVELSADACKRSDCASQRTGKPHVYVGETKKTPKERLADHRAGGFTSRPVVRKYGIRLRPRLYRAVRVCRTRTESLAAEARLAARLRRRGYCVFGGH
jgi:hypothetical protein